MKATRLAVWLSLIAGLLFLTAALRDIFAPGFFNNGQLKTKADIVFEFAAAVTFLMVAFSWNQRASTSDKK